jgi:hypothetical protein
MTYASVAVNSSAHSVNDDDGITGATKAMRLVYFASIYGGVKDPVKVGTVPWCSQMWERWDEI